MIVLNVLEIRKILRKFQNIFRKFRENLMNKCDYSVCESFEQFKNTVLLIRLITVF